jgi:hypothetical protein
VTIEITFIFWNETNRKFGIHVMCLGCIYLSGSHDAPTIAKLIRGVFAAYGLQISDVRVYVSDSGGGIPAAVKELNFFQSPLLFA